MNATETQDLEVLAQAYPTKKEAMAELVYLASTLNLPKTMELFVSDPHGEYEAFSHILRSACGSIRRDIDVLLPSMDTDTKDSIATLVYYPRRKVEAAFAEASDVNTWLANSIVLLSSLAAFFATARNSRDVARLIPEEFTDTVLEFTSMRSEDYLSAAALNAVKAGCAPALIEALAITIQRLAVGRVHMVGDVYDRGPAPELIMDELMQYPDIDIQWGNHDIVWMGAALGQRGCISHVVRNCARYGNLGILEDAYGFDLKPLYDFALEAYADDPCVAFGLKVVPEGISEEDLNKNIKVQKAMAIIQFKVEAAHIDDNPSFGLEDRKLLHRINRQTNTIVIDGVEYELADTVFPTVDWNDPYRLTEGEKAVISYLQECFQNCERLQRHMAFFLERGSLYKICNNHLLFHACVPLNADGSLKEVNIYGKTLKGRALFDAVDGYIRDAFYAEDETSRKQGRDLLWYLWLGEGSPLFAKSKMATFEIYLVADKAARKEVKNAFYTLNEDESVVDGILKDFGLDPACSRIVCGHVPVKVKDGEDPVKCGGKVIFIDGGMSRAYQKTTGIAGFTLVSDATGEFLFSHKPFGPAQRAIEEDIPMESDQRSIKEEETVIRVVQTDEGQDMTRLIAGLQLLIDGQETEE